MKILGIIAEYNPFHMGHKYQIKKAKELSGADYVVAIMSGNYVQRGAPAVFEKSIRTKMALNGGIDAVFEIPSFFSGASAADFARYGISLLDILGVDYISFGAENNDYDLLCSVAGILSGEEIEISIKKYLASGLNYAKARHSAIMEKLTSESISLQQRMQIEDVLSSSNNILAIEYLKNIKLIKSNIKPVIISRNGSTYHEKNIEEDKFASATAIRNALYRGKKDIFDNISGGIPLENTDILKSSKPIFEDKLYKREDLCEYCDISDELKNTINKNINEIKSRSFEDFILSLKSKNFTYTRISRAIFHILLNHKKKTLEELKSQPDMAAYPLLLGFKKASSNLLSELKLRSKKPFISKIGSAKELLCESALKLFENNIYSDFLYNSIYFEKYGEILDNPYRRKIVIL